MQPFDYVRPKDHAEAGALLAGGNGAVRPMMGGTDLIVRMRAGFARPRQVVDLKGLPGMCQLNPTSDGGLRIGAACTMNQVARHPLVQTRYHLLVQACDSVASYQLRNRATVGGNCCNASPAADTAPALYCLEALVEIYGTGGVRCLPISDFFAGPGRPALGPGEFVTALLLPRPAPGAAGAFNKLGRTRFGDISTVNVAVYAWDGGSQWRVALGAVGPTPLRAPEVEAALAADHSPAGIRAAARMAAAAARPIDDVRASASYRRAMVEVLTRRSAEATVAMLGGAA